MAYCLICKKKINFSKKFEYYSKPVGETDFGIKKSIYYRFYKSCLNCKHWFSVISPKIRMKNLYSSRYNLLTYRGLIKKNFDKVNNIPSKNSDNFYRVKRIDGFLKKFKKERYVNNLSLLDIGSGLGIFPYRMKKKNYDCTALDPDKDSCTHIKRNLKIKTIHGDFLKVKIKKKFDLITLNKVIEHVKNPKALIAKSIKNLKKDGVIYIEVPDEKAKIKGKNREEFFIDHLHVFSKKSLSLITKKLNLKVEIIKSIQEPSSKFSIFGFFTIKDKTLN
tara:strand:- start:4928 stop:5758 length:831 start_codon:yes stop_codon:yes gene_type:complete